MSRIVTVNHASVCTVVCIRPSSCYGDVERLGKVTYLVLKFLMVTLGPISAVSHSVAVLQERNYDVKRGLITTLHSRTCFRLFNVSLVIV
jgi:hypothetical protein